MGHHKMELNKKMEHEMKINEKKSGKKESSKTDEFTSIVDGVLDVGKGCVFILKGLFRVFIVFVTLFIDGFRYIFSGTNKELKHNGVKKIK